MRPFVLIALLCAILSAPLSAARINELRIDQPSNDDDEYFELVGTPGELLDGLSYVVIGDGSAGSGEIEFALDLSGSFVPADGVFLAAEDGDTFGTAADLLATLDFENSDNVTHLLVAGFSGADADDLDVNDDGLLDTLPWTSVIDGLALVEVLAVPPAGTEYHYAGQLGVELVGPDGSASPAHAIRAPHDGAFRVGAFDPAAGLDTPGASNVPEPTSLVLAGLAALGYLAIRASRVKVHGSDR
jgi:hypothetical protein